MRLPVSPGPPLTTAPSLLLSFPNQDGAEGPLERIRLGKKRQRIHVSFSFFCFLCFSLVAFYCLSPPSPIHPERNWRKASHWQRGRSKMKGFVNTFSKSFFFFCSCFLFLINLLLVSLFLFLVLFPFPFSIFLSHGGRR